MGRRACALALAAWVVGCGNPMSGLQFACDPDGPNTCVSGYVCVRAEPGHTYKGICTPAGEVPDLGPDPGPDFTPDPGLDAGPDPGPDPAPDVKDAGSDGEEVPDGLDSGPAPGQVVLVPATVVGVVTGGGLVLMPFTPAAAWTGESAGGGLKLRAWWP